MPKLVFHCAESEYVPNDIPALIKELQEIGFIGERWHAPATDDSKQHYLIGENFLSLVTFMGCAPAIELAPLSAEPESTDFCHFEIEAVKDKVTFVRGSDHIISRCPHCRQRHTNWQLLPENLMYACDKCGVATHLSEYDWKNTAGCGRFFISLHGIYPQEAIPTDSVLQRLEKISGTKWSYFYIQ